MMYGQNHIKFTKFSRSSTCNEQHACYVPANRKEPFPAPILSMVIENMMLAAMHRNNTCGPRLREECHYGEQSAAACCHSKRLEWRINASYRRK